MSKIKTIAYGQKKCLSVGYLDTRNCSAVTCLQNQAIIKQIVHTVQKYQRSFDRQFELS